MARARISEARHRAAFIQSGQRIVAQGGRPHYRVRLDPDDAWRVEGCPWLVVDASTRRGAEPAARVAIAALLECRPDEIDIQVVAATS